MACWTQNPHHRRPLTVCFRAVRAESRTIEFVGDRQHATFPTRLTLSRGVWVPNVEPANVGIGRAFLPRPLAVDGLRKRPPLVKLTNRLRQPSLAALNGAYPFVVLPRPDWKRLSALTAVVLVAPARRFCETVTSFARRRAVATAQMFGVKGLLALATVVRVAHSRIISESTCESM